jgi:hemolysin III
MSGIVNDPDRPGEPAEEIANALTHGAGIALSVACTITLVILAALRGDAYDIAATAVFGSSLILLYVASTLYHSARDAARRSRLQVLDHCAIYLLIAGSYTPFALGALRGGWGWTLFGLTWGLALLGVLFKLRFTGRYSVLSTAVYLVMGWLAVFATKPLVASLTSEQLAWLIAGGLLYTGGVPFYVWKSRKYTHAIWHLFVLGGVACHFVAVLSVVTTPL